MGLLSVPCCCCNKRLHVFWFSHQQRHYPTVLEVASLKWVPLGLNQGVARAGFFLDVLGRIRFLAFSSFSRSAVCLGSGLPSSLFSSSNGRAGLSCRAFLRRCLTWLHPSLIKTLWITLVPPGKCWMTSPPQDQLINDLNSIRNLNSPFP